MSSTNVTQCQCILGFVWNSIMNLCVKDCSIIDGADSLNIINISQCVCLTNFIWSANGTCNLNISADPNLVNLVSGFVVRIFGNCSASY
mgnify:CR=1 FL=1